MANIFLTFYLHNLFQHFLLAFKIQFDLFSDKIFGQKLIVQFCTKAFDIIVVSGTAKVHFFQDNFFRLKTGNKTVFANSSFREEVRPRSVPGSRPSQAVLAFPDLGGRSVLHEVDLGLDEEGATDGAAVHDTRAASQVAYP
jgi:hypothetical protein